MQTTERDAILDKLAEGFMVPVIEEGEWAEITDKHGEGSCCPAEYLADAIDGMDRPLTIEIRHGFGARLSAPGYMDATEWAVFATEDEAKDYLVETYGDDVEIESEDDEAVAS